MIGMIIVDRDMMDGTNIVVYLSLFEKRINEIGDIRFKHEDNSWIYLTEDDNTTKVSSRVLFQGIRNGIGNHIMCEHLVDGRWELIDRIVTSSNVVIGEPTFNLDKPKVYDDMLVNDTMGNYLSVNEVLCR